MASIRRTTMSRSRRIDATRPKSSGLLETRECTFRDCPLNKWSHGIDVSGSKGQSHRASRVPCLHSPPERLQRDGRLYFVPGGCLSARGAWREGRSGHARRPRRRRASLLGAAVRTDVSLGTEIAASMEPGTCLLISYHNDTTDMISHL